MDKNYHVVVIEGVSALQSLPIDEPVAVFAIALASFLIAPILIERVGMPGIVGIVIAGIVLGPNATGILEHGDAIRLLGSVGLVYLLFIIGVDLDLQQFFNEPEDAALFGLFSFSLPLIVGTVVGIYLIGLGFWPSLLLASVFASHTLLAYPIIDRLDIAKNDAVTAVFGGILFTDTLALVMLVIVLGAVDGGVSALLLGEIVLKLAILFGGLWLIVPRIARWFFTNLHQESYFEFLFVLTLIFIGASLAEALELAAILGAFVVGLALNQKITRGGTLMNRLDFIGNAFFIPFFLLDVGMLVDPAVIFDGVQTLWIAFVIIATMFVMKFVAAGGVTAIQGYSRSELGVIWGLSIGQAAAALAITLIGFEAGVFGAFGDEVLNAVVLMLLVSAVASPWVTRRFGHRLTGEQDIGELDREPFDPVILLPLSHISEYQGRLVDLAFAIKESPATTPVHLLRVLSPDASTEAIAQAESDLEDTAEYGSAAEVEVEVETRVNRNVASGIVNGQAETRADVILMGWDATRSIGGRVFGSIIDQVRKRTRVPVVISRLDQPINTSDRVVLVLPAGVDHNEGFFESVFLIKRLTDNIGIELHVIAGDGSVEHYERLIDMVEPSIPFTVEIVNGWSGLDRRLRKADENDLIVSLKPREGTAGWQRNLRQLPRSLGDMPPKSFIVVTPRRGDPDRDSIYLRIR